MIFLLENETKIFNQENPLCKYGFDTMADYPDLPGLDRVAPGSTAFCLDTSDAYMLRSDTGEWEKL
jgi:hypothetical protein